LISIAVTICNATALPQFCRRTLKGWHGVIHRR